MRLIAPRHPHLTQVGVIALVAGYSWWAAGLRPFTAPMDAAVAAPAVIAAVLVWRRPPVRPPATSSERPGRPPTWGEAAPWVGLLGCLAVLEIFSYLSAPRRAHPTLSSMADSLMSTHPGRAALFAGWLILGWLLLLRKTGP